MTEFDAYNDAEKDYKMIRNEILNNERGIDLTKLLDLSVAKNLDKTKDIYENKENKNVNIPRIDIKKIEKILYRNKPKIKKDAIESNLENVRILLGNVKGSTEKVYWEYGHKKLPNRHILISGKSGQGKTYFMQCLLYELSLIHI